MQADLLSSFARHTAASKAPGRTHSMSNTAPLRASLFPGISLEQRKNVHVVYKTLEDTLWYMYGSAEVIGLMMAKIMGLKMCSCHTAESALLATPVRTHRTKSTAPLRASPPPSISSLPDSCKTTITARLQGRAMQFINFLRDIQEDNTLGRLYFPAEDLEKFGLRNLSQQTAQQDPDKFKEFMRYQLRRYSEWQAEANLGFHYIPRRLRIPLQTARDMYNWTATTIATDPLVVFNKKVKPRKRRVIVRGLYNGVIVLPGFG
jgi:15-cis-phytoene synthase